MYLRFSLIIQGVQFIPPPKGGGSSLPLDPYVIGSKSLEINGEPSLSTDLLMKVMYLLPQNSAVGMQESKNPVADLALITDTEWPKGIYILTSAIYSPGSGLSGLKQEAVEVI